MKKRVYKYIAFIASIALIAFLLSKIDIEVLWKSITGINLYYYFAAFGCYVLSYFCLISRLYILLGRADYGRLTVFMFIQKFLNRVLPLRSGEIFFPILLKKICRIDYTHGISKLFLVRLADLASLFISFLIACLFIGLNFNLKEYAMIVACLVFSLYVILSVKSIFPFLVLTLNRISPQKWKPKLERLAESSSEALTVSTPKFIFLIVISVIDKFINYFKAFFMMIGLGYHFKLIEVISSSVTSAITEILPVNSVGSFGTTELGWAGAMMYFGYSQQDAIASGFGFNILTFSFTTILCLIGIFLAIFVYKVWYFKTPEPSIETQK